MSKSITSINCSIVLAFSVMVLFVASTVQAATIPVTYTNYAEVESSMQMERYQKLAKGINKWYYFRTPTPIDNQPTIRMNRDTLYSMALVNVSNGAVITLPDTGKRYISLALNNEHGYTNTVYYGKGTYTLTPESVGSNYALLLVRILVDAEDKKDVKLVNDLQDKILIDAKDATPFTMPKWDMKDYKAINSTLIELFALVPNADKMFGKKENVNPILHLLGLAGGFGGLPAKDAIYISVSPMTKEKSYMMTLKDVPVDGFWSITSYNKEGYIFNSKYGEPSLNNLSATPAKDGTYTLYFGNCKMYKENCIAITDGWNYTMRLYQPDEKIISGKWTFPVLKVVE